jgi:hypothetical protein
VVHADKAGSWDNLHERFEVKGIKRQEAYSLDGACTHQAEKYFRRLRRAEVRIHHHTAGAYFIFRYARESPWREDISGVSNDDQVNCVAALAVKARQLSSISEARQPDRRLRMRLQVRGYVSNRLSWCRR